MGFQGLSLFFISTPPLRQLSPRPPQHCFFQTVCPSPRSLSSALGPLPTQHHIPRGTFFSLQIPCTGPCIPEGLDLSCSPLSSKTPFPFRYLHQDIPLCDDSNSSQEREVAHFSLPLPPFSLPSSRKQLPKPGVSASPALPLAPYNPHSKNSGSSLVNIPQAPVLIQVLCLVPEILTVGLPTSLYLPSPYGGIISKIPMWPLTSPLQGTDGLQTTCRQALRSWNSFVPTVAFHRLSSKFTSRRVSPGC